MARSSKKLRLAGPASSGGAAGAGDGEDVAPTIGVLPAACDGPDYFSDLPDSLICHILTLIPYKTAIRTSVLSSRWRVLYRQRWSDPSSLKITNAIDADLLTLRRGCRRLDGMALSFDARDVSTGDLKRWVDYSAACQVEDLEIRSETGARAPGSAFTRRKELSVHFPPGSPLLARLVLSGVHLSAAPSPQLLSHLEVVVLHSVSLSDVALRKIVAAAPLLRSLDLRHCRGIRRINITAAGSRFTKLTVTKCPAVVKALFLPHNVHLRSFHFVGGSFLTNYCLGPTSNLEDLCMASGGPEFYIPASNWVTAIGNLMNIRVLTLCGLALQYVLVAGKNTFGTFKNLKNLQELQLLMFIMANSNLTDIYEFFRICMCSQLEKFFLELPTSTRDPYVENFMAVAEERPIEEICLDNLAVVKISNFKGHRNEMQLVKFFLEKAQSLRTFVVIAPPEQFDDRDGRWSMSPSLDLELEHCNKASENVEFICAKLDDGRFLPTHAEAFLK